MECPHCGSTQQSTTQEDGEIACVDCGYILIASQKQTQELSLYDLTSGGNSRFLRNLGSTVMNKQSAKGRNCRRGFLERFMPWRLSELIVFVILPQQTDALIGRLGITDCCSPKLLQQGCVPYRATVERLMRLYLCCTGEAYFPPSQRDRVSLWKYGWGDWHFPQPRNEEDDDENNEILLSKTRRAKRSRMDDSHLEEFLNKKMALHEEEFYSGDEPVDEDELSRSESDNFEDDSSLSEDDVSIAASLLERGSSIPSENELWRGEFLGKGKIYLMEINLGLLYLALLLHPRPKAGSQRHRAVAKNADSIICFVDLLRLVSTQELPFLSLWNILPEEYRFKDIHVQQMLLRHHTPPLHKIRLIAYHLSKMLPISVIPRFHFVSLVHHFMEIMRLPRDLHVIARRLVTRWQHAANHSSGQPSIFHRSCADPLLFSLQHAETVKRFERKLKKRSRRAQMQQDEGLDDAADPDDADELCCELCPKQTNWKRCFSAGHLVRFRWVCQRLECQINTKLSFISAKCPTLPCPQCAGRVWLRKSAQNSKSPWSCLVIAPDSLALGMVIFLLRLVFVLDGVSEEASSRAALALNEQLRLSADQSCFQLTAWQAIQEERLRKLGKEKLVRSWRDLDDLDGTTAFQRPVQSRRRKNSLRANVSKNDWEKVEVVNSLVKPLEEVHCDLVHAQTNIQNARELDPRVPLSSANLDNLQQQLDECLQQQTDYLLRPNDFLSRVTRNNHHTGVASSQHDLFEAQMASFDTEAIVRSVLADAPCIGKNVVPDSDLNPELCRRLQLYGERLKYNTKRKRQENLKMLSPFTNWLLTFMEVEFHVDACDLLSGLRFAERVTFVTDKSKLPLYIKKLIGDAFILH